ncbi:hypothetical protein TanjilG_11369 [Lupinus angustifolius]|uniref:Uncharacterized protein n=1 Tax=Lupinus angustifolius TaxID=3871 RepID=A0A1J7HMK3_LUPAN|nr:hypothetical protein TanjilG_11369 [Lupinus angustifolius]
MSCILYLPQKKVTLGMNGHREGEPRSEQRRRQQPNGKPYSRQSMQGSTKRQENR